MIDGVIPDLETRRSVQRRAMGLLDELGNILRGVFLINDLSVKHLIRLLVMENGCLL